MTLWNRLLYNFWWLKMEIKHLFGKHSTFPSYGFIEGNMKMSLRCFICDNLFDPDTMLLEREDGPT